MIDGSVVNTTLTGEPLLLVPLLQTSNYEGGSEKFTPDPEAPAFTETDLTPAADVPLIPQMIANRPGPLPEGSKVFVSLPVVASETWLDTTDLIWKTPDHLGGVVPFELWRLGSKLPPGGRAIGTEEVDCSDPYGLHASGGESQPVWAAAYGVDAAASDDVAQATLYVSRLIDRGDPYAVRYDHATQLGAAGGPVFDLATGKIFAIHLQSEPDMARPGRRIGIGMSLPMLLNLPREELQPREGRLPPMCEQA